MAKFCVNFSLYERISPFLDKKKTLFTQKRFQSMVLYDKLVLFQHSVSSPQKTVLVSATHSITSTSLVPRLFFLDDWELSATRNFHRRVNDGKINTFQDCTRLHKTVQDCTRLHTTAQ